MNREEIREEAKVMLQELEREFLNVVLIPAPEPRYIGHMIRSTDNQNPQWYRKIFEDLGYIKRPEIKSILKRIIENDFTDKNRFYSSVMNAIIERIEEYKFYEEENKKNFENRNAGNDDNAVRGFSF